MNIHEYIEKRASLRQKYLKHVGDISSAIAGKKMGSPRVIAATAFESIVSPISHGKDLLSFPKKIKANHATLDEDIVKLKDALKTLRDPSMNFPKDEAKRLEGEALKHLADHKKMKSDVSALTRNAYIGSGIGYGTLGYGGYKGGQKVKKYLQDKKRGK